MRTRLVLAEEQLTDLEAVLEDMRRDRDAGREQAQTRMLPGPSVVDICCFCSRETHHDNGLIA